MKSVAKTVKRFPAIFAALLLSGCQLPAPPSATVTASVTAPVAQTRMSLVRYKEVAKEAGLNHRFKPRGTRPLTILGTIGQGCAFLDYDADSNLDILLVDSSPVLFRGNGKGQFTPVNVLPALKGHFSGCAVGDADNDGFPEIYLTGYREGRFLKNEQGKRFSDQTKEAGIPPQHWSTSASFADINRDGFLDLYIANYAVFDSKTQPQLCDFNGIMSACGPRFYVPERGKLYKNHAGKRFTDITTVSGAAEVHGRGLGVAIADFDGSGQDSIAIANDEIPGDLLRNQGNARFVNEGEQAGTARNSEGSPYGGMGIDWGDYNNDGQLDLAVGTYQNEIKLLYQNEGDGLFSDRSGSMQMDSKALPYVTFGLKFLDVENDGLLDLVLANGHVQDNMEQIDKALTYRQPLVLLGNVGNRYDDLTPSAFIDLGPIVGRGLATGDYDNDGRVDILVVDMEGEPLLLHNETQKAGNYLRVALVGTGKSNRSAYGAIVTATLPDGSKRVRHCQSDGSYMSASDARVHFGLGAVERVTLSVRWPDGTTSRHPDLTVNQTVRILQPPLP